MSGLDLHQHIAADIACPESFILDPGANSAPFDNDVARSEYRLSDRLRALRLAFTARFHSTPIRPERKSCQSICDRLAFVLHFSIARFMEDAKLDHLQNPDSASARQVELEAVPFYHLLDFFVKGVELFVGAHCSGQGGKSLVSIESSTV